MGVVRTEAPLRVEVLGPIRVLDAAGRDVTPAGALQRRLLALLVLRRGRVVSVDAAVDALWPADRPADPAAALQNHVSRLRRAVPASVDRAVDDGYRLDPASVDVDADRLARPPAATAPPTHDVDEPAAAVARAGLSPSSPTSTTARAEAARLDELRARALEVRRRAAGSPRRHRRPRRRAGGARRRAPAAGATARSC